MSPSVTLSVILHFVPKQHKLQKAVLTPLHLCSTSRALISGSRTAQSKTGVLSSFPLSRILRRSNWGSAGPAHQLSFHFPPPLNCDDKSRSFKHFEPTKLGATLDPWKVFCIYIPLLWRSSGVFTQLWFPSSLLSHFVSSSFFAILYQRVCCFLREESSLLLLPPSRKISQKEEKSVVLHTSITVLLRDTRILPSFSLSLSPLLYFILLFSSCVPFVVFE